MFISSLISSPVLFFSCTWSQKVLLRYLSSLYLLFYKSQILTFALVHLYVYLFTTIHQIFPVNWSSLNENKNSVCVDRAYSSVYRFIWPCWSIGDWIVCQIVTHIYRPNLTYAYSYRTSWLILDKLITVDKFNSVLHLWFLWSLMHFEGQKKNSPRNFFMFCWPCISV
jgi:hypothetical protein